MELTMTMLFGMLSMTCAILAVVFLCAKIHIPSGVLGIAAVVLIVLSTRYWRVALIESGKNPQWLGYERYPFVLYVCIALVAAGLFCTIAGVVGFIRKKRT